MTETEVPTRHSGSGERLIPQCFSKPGNETNSVINYVVLPMATSAVFKKLESELDQGAASQPQLELKGKGKGKGRKNKNRKGKGKGEIETEPAQPISWSPLAFPLVETGSAPTPELARPKTALDDFMHCFLEVKTAFEKKLSNAVRESDEHAGRSQSTFNDSTLNLFGHGVSYFFEFVWTGNVAINGKFVRTYSAFRTELTTFISTACELAAASAASGGSRMTLAADFSHLIDSTPCSGVHVGHLKDETDEVKAIDRLKITIPAAIRSGMDGFIKDVLCLPIEYHAAFTQVSLALLSKMFCLQCSVN